MSSKRRTHPPNALEHLLPEVTVVVRKVGIGPSQILWTVALYG